MTHHTPHFHQPPSLMPAEGQGKDKKTRGWEGKKEGERKPRNKIRNVPFVHCRVGTFFHDSQTMTNPKPRLVNAYPLVLARVVRRPSPGPSLPIPPAQTFLAATQHPSLGSPYAEGWSFVMDYPIHPVICRVWPVHMPLVAMVFLFSGPISPFPLRISGHHILSIVTC